MKNIVQIYNNQPSDCSDFFYRVAQRSREFVKHYKVKWTNIINLHEEKSAIAKTADLLIVNFVADIDIIPILEYREQQNLPTIYEVNDNFLAFQANNPMFSYYSRVEVQAQIFDYITRVDGIQLSSELLADELQLTTLELPNISVLKNCIDTIYETIHRNNVIIGWGGSSGHYEDVKTISKDLIDISKKYNVKISIMSDKKIASLFSELGDNLIYTPFSNMDDYHNFLSTLTIGICTISKDEFNRTRSDVKYLEYISHGVIPLCSNFGPYENLENCIKFEDDFYIQLESILTDTDKMKKNQDRILHYAQSRLTSKAVNENFDFYSKFITIEKGDGVYKEICNSSLYPDLYDLISGFIAAPKTDYNSAMFYYVKYSNSIEKIEYAIDHVDRNSLILKKRYIELLFTNKRIDEGVKILDNYLKLFPNVIDFITMRLIIANNRAEKAVINGLKLRLKKVSPYIFNHYFGV